MKSNKINYLNPRAHFNNYKINIIYINYFRHLKFINIKTELHRRSSSISGKAKVLTRGEYLLCKDNGKPDPIKSNSANALHSIFPEQAIAWYTKKGRLNTNSLSLKIRQRNNSASSYGKNIKTARQIKALSFVLKYF